ncbi:hypothetical protein ACS0TY_006582 [Phlomoides rotata]
MGDFNVVLGAHERSRGARNPARPSQEFMAFMDEAHLHDMDTSGPQYTWVTRRSNHGYMAARLDRVLTNDGFLDIWHSVNTTVLPRISSDHHPILLTLQETADHSIRPFRFQNMWTTHPSFLPLVSESWGQFVTSYNPIHRVTQKLKRLKASLKNWNKATFRNIFVEMEAATAALTAIQTESATLGDSEERLLEEIECTNRLNTVLSSHQIRSTQRNRLKWLQDGDRNSKFFHTMNRIRKSSCGLSSLMVDGILTFDPGIISDAVVQFYTELFTASDQEHFEDTILGQITQIRNSPRYLFYADDILIFAKATVANIARLQSILSSYGRLSGQIYNPAKSKVYYGSVVPRRVRNFMLRTTGISQGSLPMSYLGVPLFRGAPRVCHLAPLADSIISRFSKWKGHTLSLAGRKCLINSVIAASLVHSMMVYYWPRSLLKKIEIAMRNFLWTGDINRRNTSCTVSWARVCAPLEEGGLGVRSIRHANDSFICKLAWDILCNKNSDISMLHTRYISGKSRPRHYGNHSSIWPGVRRHLDRLEDGSRWTVGQHSGISFWNDNWLGYIISDKIGIPQFFASGLKSKIGDFFFDGHWHFDQDFFLNYTDIIRDILSIHISRGDDTRVWGHAVSGQMTSSMAYDHLRANHPKIGWSSWIWGRSIPPCRSTLIWRAIWGKLPTADWLRQFGIHGPTVCFLCHNDSESLDHIFAYCPFTRNLLGRVTALFDLSLYYDIGFLDVFLQATRYQFSKQLGHLWRIAFITTLWSIWHARNRAIFDDIQPSIQRCMATILTSITETDYLAKGDFSGSVHELMILGRLGLSGRPSLPISTIVIRWRPPQADWIKVNVDGSTPLSPGPLFAGAIFRNSRGFFVAAFSKTVGWGYPLEAELAAIFHAILFAYDYGWLSLWVESDSTLAIHTIQRRIQIIPWRLQGLWEKVQMAQPHMRITYSHILREGNQAADTIAKFHSDEDWFGNCPHILDQILYRDMNSDYFRCVHS